MKVKKYPRFIDVGPQTSAMVREFEWSDNEIAVVPLAVRNAIEALASLMLQSFKDGEEYIFGTNKNGKLTLRLGEIATYTDHRKRGTLPETLVKIWNQVGYGMLNSIWNFDSKMTTLNVMRIIDALLKKDFDDQFWTRRANYTRKDFVREIQE